jgi:hypothetical protein
MSSEEKERSGSLVWVIGVLALAPLLYVLSIGPVVMLCERAGVNGGAVRMVYAPVIWLHNNTPLQKPLEWYAGLWGWK